MILIIYSRERNREILCWQQVKQTISSLCWKTVFFHDFGPTSAHAATQVPANRSTAQYGTSLSLFALLPPLYPHPAFNLFFFLPLKF